MMPNSRLLICFNSELTVPRALNDPGMTDNFPKSQFSSRLTLKTHFVLKCTSAGMTDHGETVNLEFLDFSKAFNSMCHRLFVKMITDDNLKIKRCVEEFINNRTFIVILGGHLSS